MQARSERRLMVLAIFMLRLTRERSLWLFGIVAAGEVHPQPQFLSFGYAPTIIFQ